jgi:quinol monooxygenase YgiN
MHFSAEFVDVFKILFQSVQTKISAFEGCEGVQLLQDQSNPELFFTISQWNNAACLENYRQSEFFKQTWAMVKPNFKNKAEAWSLLVP